MTMKWSPGCQCCGEGCPCGSALWTWDAGASEWNVGSNTCSGACVPIEPNSPGTVDLEEQTTCCAFGCFGANSVSSTMTPAALSDAEVRSWSPWELEPEVLEFTSRTAVTDLVTYERYDTASCGAWLITAQRIRLQYTDLGGGGGDKSDDYDVIVWTRGVTGQFFGDYFTSLESYLYFGIYQIFPEGTGWTDTDAEINNAIDINYLSLTSGGSNVNIRPYGLGTSVFADISVFVTGPSPVPGFTEPYANATVQSRYDWVTGYSATVG